MWKGSIAFGLVSVPVNLYKAVEEHSGPSAHMVHATDGGAIKMKRFCEDEGVEVPYADIAKSYAGDDGREAVITSEDLTQLPLPSKRIIDVLAFVDADTIDPLRLSSPYYIGVQPKAAAKPYVLLRDALTESGKIAVTKVTLQTRESLAVLRVHGELLILQTLLWPDEIREPEFAAPTAEAPVRPQELKMARSLMDTLSEDFDLDELHDDYALALQELIDSKLGNKPLEAGQPAPSGGGKVLDLMGALQSSVKAAKEAHSKSAGTATQQPAAKKPTARKSTSTQSTAAKKAAPAKKAAAKKTSARKAS
ncbi:non-homologous end joining protein Ku [Streptacidiphilus sp. PAMC 29251]